MLLLVRLLSIFRYQWYPFRIVVWDIIQLQVIFIIHVEGLHIALVHRVDIYSSISVTPGVSNAWFNWLHIMFVHMVLYYWSISFKYMMSKIRFAVGVSNRKIKPCSANTERISDTWVTGSFLIYVVYSSWNH